MFHISLSGGAWSIVWGYNPTKVPPWWWDWNGHQLLWGWKTHFWGEICHDICHHNTVTTTLSPRHLSLQHCQSYEMFYTRLRNLIKSIETKMTPQAGGSAHMTQQHLPAVTLQQGSPNFLFEVNISTTVRGLCLRAHNSSRAGHNSHHRWCDYFGICCILLMQPLRWCCVDCVIHHERDVREE